MVEACFDLSIKVIEFAIEFCKKHKEQKDWKYVFLSSSSKFKGMSDFKKYESSAPDFKQYEANISPDMKKYDFLIIGAGLYGSTFARLAKDAGKSVIVVEKRNHIGGNIYTKKENNIDVHVYGAHIFHTSDKIIWDYVNQFVAFNRFTNSPVANYRGELYSLPFNSRRSALGHHQRTPSLKKSRIHFPSIQN